MKKDQNKLVVFQEKEIRRMWHNEEWWFVIVDIIEVLTASKNPAVYWRVLKKRLKDEGSNETVANCNGLKLEAKDGKRRKVNCANVEGIFRVIQSIPSPKAEPFKQWLAKVGYERVQEIENLERVEQYYRELSYILEFGAWNLVLGMYKLYLCKKSHKWASNPP